MRSTELIVALDVPSAEEMRTVLRSLPETVTHYKIGLELYTREGPSAVRALQECGKSVFLDLKLHDIPRTVARAVAAASALNVSLLTVHTAGGREMLRAAAEAAAAAGNTRPRLIAVTTLTSLGPDDFADLGIARDMAEQALALGEMAISAGMDGLVTSALELRTLRTRFGTRPLLVTPGIRPANDATGDDQKRIATPGKAVHAGADYLVVGRPILSAPNPAAAALAVLEEMRAAAV